MSILIDKKTKIIVQGFTGKIGSFHASEMIQYGTNVEKGNKILKESKIKYIEASTLEDAANKAVVALKKLKIR